MDTDGVERDLWIIATQLGKLSESFGSFAAQLTRYRKFGSKSVMRRTPGGETNQNEAEEAEPPLSFSGEWMS